MKAKLSLATFHDQLLDGLDFCQRVYDLLDQVRAEPDGVDKIRRLATKREKRLTEELLPIACYVQARYRAGRRLKVRWFNDSRPFDAILWSSGQLVRWGYFPRRVVIEVTTYVHKNAHLVKQVIQERGWSGGVKGIRRTKNGPVSTPHLYVGDETAIDLATQILGRIRSKSKKHYPPSTVLIVQCYTDRPLTAESEWNAAIERVCEAEPVPQFREIFLFEPIQAQSATLYGKWEHPR